MARNFDGVDDKIDCGSDATIDDIWDGGGTLFAWIRAESDGQTDSGRVFDKRTSGSWMWWMSNETAGNMVIRFTRDFTSSIPTWTTDNDDIIVDTWHATGCDYDNDSTANDPVFWIDGSSVAISGTPVPDGTRKTDAPAVLNIGNTSGQTTTFDGDIFYCALWIVVLTTKQQVALANGIPPMVVSGDKPVFFMPIWGNQSPEPDYIGQTSTGTVTGTIKSTNPAVELLENYL